MTPTLYAVVDDISSFVRRLVFGKQAVEAERRTLARAHVSPLLRRLVFGKQAVEAERRTLARAHVSPLTDGEGGDEAPLPTPAVPVSAEVSPTELAREQPER